MNIIGLGTVGCDIAAQFLQYKQFTVYKINEDIENDNQSFCVPTYEKPEQYETNFPSIPFQLEEELTLILSGEDNCSLSSLRILEQYKDLELKIIYIKPDLKFMNPIQKMVDRVVYSVLQELTRSAKISLMYLVDLKLVADILGKVSLKERQTKLYSTLAYSYYMKNMFENIQSVYEKTIDTPSTYGIRTFGVMDFETGIEKNFFPLDNIREKSYNYYIVKQELEEDTDLFDHIEQQINTKFSEEQKVSYYIFESNLDSTTVFVEYKSPYIQGIV